jgi:hypothetical protein
MIILGDKEYVFTKNVCVTPSCIFRYCQKHLTNYLTKMLNWNTCRSYIHVGEERKGKDRERDRQGERQKGRDRQGE